MENENNAVVAHPDYKTEIAQLVKSNLAPKRMRQSLMDYHENDLAAALEMLEREERNKLYGVLNADTLAGVLEYAENMGEYLSELSIRRRVDILSRIESPMAVLYLEGLDKKTRNELLELLPEEPKHEISMLASFDKDEIGSKMTTNYISVHAGLDVREVMQELIKQAAQNDNVSTIYVVDETDTFAGAIDLKDLIVARRETPLESITMTSYPYVYANEPIDECIERIRGYSEDSIPVLDRENKLCGVLTAQDVAEMVEDEIGDDYAKLGGLSSEEELGEPLRRSIGKRLPWLIVLFGLGLLVSSVVGLFESVVSHLSLIVAFQSLILGMAGNVGTQSLAVTIRMLGDESLTGRQKWYLIAKESRVGLCNGVILGALSLLLIGGLLFFRGEAPTLAFSVSLCTGVSLLIAMLLSSIAGTGIPLLFQKLKIDPAVASGPFITTVNDLVAVVTYYGLSWVLLIRVLQL